MKLPTIEEQKQLEYKYNIITILENTRKEAIKNCNRYIDLNSENKAACSDRLAILDYELSTIQNILSQVSQLNRKEANA